MTTRRTVNVYGGGLVVKDDRGWHFYAADGFTGDHDEVIKQAEKMSGHELFIYRAVGLEPVEGTIKDLALDRTSIRVIPSENDMENDIRDIQKLFSLKEIPASRIEVDYDNHWVQECGETLAHCIVYAARQMTEDERKKIPFHLFSKEILSMEDSPGYSVALRMAVNGIFPPEMINDETLDIDSSGRILHALYTKGAYRKYWDKIDNFLTRERLIHSCDGWGNSLAYAVAIDKNLPEDCMYVPEIVNHYNDDDNCYVLDIIVNNNPDYFKKFPVESMTAKDVKEFLDMEVELNGRMTKVKNILILENNYPKNETQAMFWLVEGEEKEMRAAELFYEIEFPEIYKEIIETTRGMHKKHAESLSMENISEIPDFVADYIL